MEMKTKRVVAHIRGQARQMDELNLELMKLDQAEEARKARQEWLRRRKLSPGVWIKREVGLDYTSHNHILGLT